MTMLRPMNTCTVTRMTGADLYGEPVLGASSVEHCSIVKVERHAQHTTVRADASASRAYAEEFVANFKLLVLPRTRARVGDRIDVAGVALRVEGLMPRFDVWGVLDHYEVMGAVWA